MSSFADLVAIGDESPEPIAFPAIPGVVFHIKPAGRVYQQALNDAQLQYQLKHGKPLSGDDATKVQVRLDAQHLVAGWEGIDDTKFSVEKARELMWKSFPVHQFIRTEAQRIANRRSGVAEELVGNSESTPDELFAGGQE